MKYSALKGIQDILPPDIFIWQRVESDAREVFSSYGFLEMRLPVIESTDLFRRSIGETTDIVEKEMYTFTDKGGRSVTLRPEGTAPAVRCYVEHNLHNLASPQRFFYRGPMFRYERPQKGRFRQFYQIGAEAFGIAHPSLDAEVLAMLRHFLKTTGLTDLAFEINSIGCDACRPSYKEALRAFFDHRKIDLCADCQRRLLVNPLRILDCKVERCVELRQGSPVVADYLCGSCKEHFDELLKRLDAISLPYTLNPNLARGLDYYTRTTFEVTSKHLGAQKAVAAGGRYDGLVEEFGGPATPAIGFAIGMERLVTLLRESNEQTVPYPKIFIATLGRDAEIEGLRIAQALREKGHWTETNYSAGSLKNQIRKADRMGAAVVLIVGDNELKSGIVKWKNLKNGSQGEIDRRNITEVITDAGILTSG